MEKNVKKKPYSPVDIEINILNSIYSNKEKKQHSRIMRKKIQTDCDFLDGKKC
jgi:hypothetical protein